jgi:hypothetical protein
MVDGFMVIVKYNENNRKKQGRNADFNRQFDIAVPRRPAAASKIYVKQASWDVQDGFQEASRRGFGGGLVGIGTVWDSF